MEADIPDYAAEPLRGFLDYLRNSSRLLHTSLRGLSIVQRMPDVIRTFTRIKVPLDATELQADQAAEALENQKTLERAQSDAEFAEREGKNGFPLLHAHTLVGLWGALEAAIEDMVVGILVNEPALLQNESIGKVRIPVAEFEMLEKEERMRLLIAEIKRNGACSKKSGVEHFEALLEQIGLGGNIDADCKKDSREMHNVRNVIIHRRGIADRRLITACPWMGLKAGDKAVVSHDDLSRYSAAIGAYILALAYRLGARYGVDIEARVAHLREGPEPKAPEA